MASRLKKSEATITSIPRSPTQGPIVKKVYLISSEALRRCSDAGLRVVMPSPGNPEVKYAFELLPSGSLVIEATQPSGTRRVLLPSVAFAAELA